jgi:DNA-binding transcriptional MerR regulator
MEDTTVATKKYTKGFTALSKALRELGLPSSVKTLREYEKAGLIPEPKKTIGGHRLYTEEDIQKIISIVAGSKNANN